ncbi:hypothetical protein [Bacillus paranthracis]|uniref:hypothetical protein n=1 Tax=Bacillus paranthracis TaxID=2026186 RepID=UPI0022E62598|nr:hypothetical protein [Bacillus paranthracis]
MVKRTQGKSKLEQLVEWNKRVFVDKMLDDGDSPNKVHKWINENGLKVSVPTVYSYAKRRKEAIMKGVKMEAIADKRTKKGKAHKSTEDGSYAEMVVEENKSHRKSNTTKRSKKKSDTKDDTEERKAQQMSVHRVKSDMEIIDAIIDKGFSTLQLMEVISPDMALKAIKLKNEITGGNHNGLTMYGLEEIRLREAARENAMLAILLEYIPEEKHEEVLTKMETATREYYESLGMGDVYDAMVEDEEDDVNEQHA